MRRRGLSLLEVMVALGIVAALAIALGDFVGDLEDSRDRLAETTRRQRTVDAMFTTLERALATTVVEDARLGAGVRGTAERLEVVARDVPAWRLGSPTTRGTAFDDRQRVVVVGGFGPGEAAGRLQRPEQGSGRETPLDAVVRFRYHDGVSWRGEFDSSAAGSMPRLVEVNLWWPRPGDFDDVESIEDPLAELDGFGSDDPLEDDAASGAERAAGFDLADVASGVSREDLGGPARSPDRVRLIAIPDAGPPKEDPDDFEFGEFDLEASEAGDPS